MLLVVKETKLSCWSTLQWHAAEDRSVCLLLCVSVEHTLTHLNANSYRIKPGMSCRRAAAEDRNEAVNRARAQTAPPDWKHVCALMCAFTRAGPVVSCPRAADCQLKRPVNLLLQAVKTNFRVALCWGVCVTGREPHHVSPRIIYFPFSKVKRKKRQISSLGCQVFTTNCYSKPAQWRSGVKFAFLSGFLW